MAKTKKTTTKSAKTTSKKTIKPLEAPRIKLPEDDIVPQTPPTLSGIISEKIRSILGFIGKHKLKVAGLLVLLAIGGWILNNYLDTRNQLNQLANPKTSTQTEITIITDQIQGTVELPGGETPTIATVSDAEKLKGQNFFKNAENGDKVLIYAKAGKALLYRYTTKKVIEYSNVNLGNNSDQQQSQGQQSNTPQQQNAQPQATQSPQTQTTPQPATQPATNN